MSCHFRSRTLSPIVGLCLYLMVDSFAIAANQIPLSPSKIGSVAVEVSKSSVQVAEPFRVTMKVTAPKGSSVTFPPPMAKLGAFEVLKYGDALDIPTEKDEELRNWTRTWTLESIDTGPISIPSLQIQVGFEGQTGFLETESIDIQVQSVLEDRADPMKFRDIHSVIDLPVREPRSNTWVGWILGGAAGLALAAAGTFALVRRTRWLTPLQWATRELAELRDSKSLWQADAESQSNITRKVSSILREYLEMQFDIAAPMQTSDELLRSIDKDGVLNGETVSHLTTAFALADQVKFAGLQLSETELSELFDESQSLVDQIAETRLTGQTGAGTAVGTRDVDQGVLK